MLTIPCCQSPFEIFSVPIPFKAQTHIVKASKIASVFVVFAFGKWYDRRILNGALPNKKRGNHMSYIKHRADESQEDYLETILLLQKRLGQVRSIDIANEMNFTKPSVSIAMKNLRQKEHITGTDIIATKCGKL